MKPLIVSLILTLAALLSPFAFRRISRRRTHDVAANIAEGTHDAAITKIPDSAFSTRHLLHKFGSDADHSELCGASDCPIGTIPDEVVASEVGDPRGILLLGRGPTKKMVASEAIAVTDELFTAANGKVQNRPAGAGTYWYVGRALTAASADGDIIEVNDCAPVRVVIP